MYLFKFNVSVPNVFLIHQFTRSFKKDYPNPLKMSCNSQRVDFESHLSLNSNIFIFFQKYKMFPNV